MEKKEDKKKAKPQVWTKEQENLLAEWSEKASAYRWLHSRSEKRYRCRNYSFTIPVIILSTLTGTANFAMDSFVPEDKKQIAMAAVGSVNIFAGILSTLQNFLRYSELMEGHRIALVAWSKFSRDIAVELALDPNMRRPAFDFLTVCRAEFDRLIEQSPSIDDPIINQFQKKFKDTKIRKPEICNGLHPCNIFKPSEEDKLASVMANASEKMKKHALNKKWRFDDSKFDDNKFVKSDGLQPKNGLQPKEGIKTIHVSNTDMNDSMKEIDSLKSIGKVSSFKNKINKGIASETHIDELKTIIESVEKDDNDEILKLTESEDKRIKLDDEDIQLMNDALNKMDDIPDKKDDKKEVVIDIPEILEKITINIEESKSDIEESKSDIEESKSDNKESKIDEEKPILFGEFPDINKSTQTEGEDEDQGEGQEFLDGIEDVDKKDDGNNDDIINE